MDVESDTVVDDLVKLEKEIVEATVGDWERLWASLKRTSRHARPCSDAFGRSQDSVADRMKAYGL